MWRQGREKGSFPGLRWPKYIFPNYSKPKWIYCLLNIHVSYKWLQILNDSTYQAGESWRCRRRAWWRRCGSSGSTPASSPSASPSSPQSSSWWVARGMAKEGSLLNCTGHWRSRFISQVLCGVKRERERLFTCGTGLMGCSSCGMIALCRSSPFLRGSANGAEWGVSIC